MAVVVREGEPFEVAWNRFMRELISNGVIDKMKEQMYFVSRSEKNAAVRRALKKRKRKHSAAVRKERRG